MLLVTFSTILYVASLIGAQTLDPKYGNDVFAKYDDIMKSVQWGVGTASYQIEGATATGGRKPSVWDTFCRDKLDGRCATDAIKFYENYKTDIALMKSLGVKLFRMSLSWSRICIDSTPVCKPNVNGINFYKQVFAELQNAGIEPFVTLFHWDLPQALQDRYEGWLSKRIVNAFAEYARVAFTHFKTVKKWSTFNEALTFCDLGYEWTVHAPGMGKQGSRWICGHNVLLSHAKAVSIFRSMKTGGIIGMANNGDWLEPLSNSHEDLLASNAGMAFGMLWLSDPLFTGDYPPEVRQYAPKFTDAEKQLLKGSADYIGINHYSSRFVSAKGGITDKDANGNLIGPVADSNWLLVYGPGLGKMTKFLNDRYTPYHPNVPVYITENGVSVPNEDKGKIMDDSFRIKFYADYIYGLVKRAKENNINLKGYMAWSIFDNYEWADGYTKRFGLVRIDYATQKRTLKQSALWMKKYVFRRA